MVLKSTIEDSTEEAIINVIQNNEFDINVASVEVIAEKELNIDESLSVYALKIETPEEKDHTEFDLNQE